ncbi:MULTISPECIES: ABC transporter ATP-binding protein/permease [unclassified Mycolicibacterium]|uniref:ABC transporter ATP-binding protein/permease n=1 Tax=unclassified Mycolicibacterium TaxID=2636767 RepID=UPI0012DD1BDD|nr:MULTISPECIES: ABC transporter ATP-binding protein/permease [unclassified Mycolicibacterium]MUL85437.1 ABC transporter ATP-binding protein/permease [Mycolicibacterium sp. CBMA 329]MUL88799.1 ABC transporter ATP-binding protein/permease [Mycolicibacterium sp. CBMA 331]MUM03061.1 ABC transporter ATP-binding protein/permease [Mycolicibacterium sp. CBMA 334]MUM24889.1 ABC transporter ATP-binding protein/permease [Mycolicibacterium sp. CBMA 295]MUM40446.1 ABC transporter ATP-binding protein/perme
MEMFSPTLDWGDELFASLKWIGIAWVIAAVGTLAVLVTVGRLTTWGRQFWRITGAYFTGPGCGKVWLWLGTILLSVIVGVRLDVLFSYQGNDLMTGVQVASQGLAAGNEEVKQSGIHGFWAALGIFCILAAFYVARIMLDLFIMQRFMLAWRAWLTDRLTGDWLAGKAYYRTRFIDDTIDNPDQRIQSDIDIFTAGVGPMPNNPNYFSKSVLLFGAIDAVVSVISFTVILWNLSGNLTLFGFTMPRAMFWIGLLYVLIGSVVAFWIGHPLIRLTFDNERYNAAFRYALVRLRDAAEAVAFYRGEAAERLQLRQRFAPVVNNYRRFINRSVRFYGWNLSVSQIIVPLPWLLQAPRLFAGEIKLGAVSQTSSAFSNIQSSLSFFRNSYDGFAGWRASVMRLHGLVTANEQARELPELTVEPSKDCLVELESVEVRTPGGEPLVDNLDLRLDCGDTLIVTGESGAGKTTLLRSLAQLWPYATGTFRYPVDANETMFLSQMPYVPLGDLRAVVSYPAEPGSIPDEKLHWALQAVSLPQCSKRLSEVADWAKVLSPGEQQRIAFARILLTRPRAVFLDEATSALDEGLEYTMYALVRTELPDTILVSVTHRSTVGQHHERHLQLHGGGRWSLGEVEDDKAGLIKQP